MPCEHGFLDTPGATDYYVGWSVAGDRRFERISKDIRRSVVMEESIGEIAISESSPDTSGGESGYLSQLDFDPGTTVLVQRSSQPSRKYEVHQALLGAGEEVGRNILLIRYRPLPEARLESIATTVNQITILTISCTQTVPKTVSATVETIRIGRITELRRLGILATRIVNDWEPLGREMRVSIDPLDPLFNYKTVEGVFRFLHILLGKLSSRGQ